MKRIIALVCVFATLSLLLCSCGNTCERCGESTLAYNLVGDEADGIHVCDECIQKMTMGKISFDFTCEGCGQEKVGKTNTVTIDGDEIIICNTCNKHLEENGSLPE